MHANFWYRKSLRRPGTGTIYLRLLVPVTLACGTEVTERVDLSTEIDLEPRWWSKSKNSIRQTRDTPEHLLEAVSTLSNWKARADRAKKELEEADKTVTARAVAAILRRKPVPVRYLPAVLEGWLLDCDTRARRGELAESSAKQYRYRVSTLNEWPDGQRLPLADMSPATASALRDWLLTRVSASAARDLITLLHAACSWAVRQGWCEQHPLVGRERLVVARRGEVDFYEPADVLTLATADVPPVERGVLDFHLLQLVSGLSFQDAGKFLRSPGSYLFTNPITGRVFLRQRRTKARRTSGSETQVALVPATPALSDLLKLLAGYEPALLSGYARQLRRAVAAAGLERGATSHLARRTFGAYALNAGIELAVVSKMLGHESIETTRKAYAPILDTLVGESWGAAFGAPAGPVPVNPYRQLMSDLADVLARRAAAL